MTQKKMFMRAGILIAVLVCCLLVPMHAFAAEVMEDFSNCVIVTPAKSGPVEAKAITVLQEEIKKRTGIYITVQNTWPQLIVGDLDADGPEVVWFCITNQNHIQFNIPAREMRLSTSKRVFIHSKRPDQ